MNTITNEDLKNNNKKEFLKYIQRKDTLKTLSFLKNSKTDFSIFFVRYFFNTFRTSFSTNLIFFNLHTSEIRNTTTISALTPGRKKISSKVLQIEKKTKFILRVYGVKNKNIFPTAEIPMPTTITYF